MRKDQEDTSLVDQPPPPTTQTLTRTTSRCHRPKYFFYSNKKVTVLIFLIIIGTMHSDCVHLVLEVVINNNGTTGVSPAFPLGFFPVRGQNLIGLPHFPLGPHNGGVW